ncbi:MAG: peptidoglycan DD-metalloendopeptidase family protein [Bdellovibrionales bacterium]|nr:peptidoglycan DD-metalloendopeptidase family protein [Bdellovibrionales bacterium]
MSICSFYHYLACLILGLLVGCHSYEGVIHRVESGENIESIAQKFDVSKEALLKANPRAKKFPPRPGERILVPKKISRVYIPTQRRRGYIPISEQNPPTVTFPDEPSTRVGSSDVSKPSKNVSMVPALKSPQVRQKYKNKLQFLWPSEGRVVSKYGKKDQKMHNGIDIRASSQAPVLASEDGKVVFSGNELQGYGNLVIVRHQPKIYSVYAYLGTILVKKGDLVKKGQAIAKVGKTSDTAFFHFEIRQGKQALDPLKHLPSR